MDQSLYRMSTVSLKVCKDRSEGVHMSCLVCQQVECVLETRDKAQSVQLRKTLTERYPSISWLDRRSEHHQAPLQTEKT